MAWNIRRLVDINLDEVRHIPAVFFADAEKALERIDWVSLNRALTAFGVAGVV